jgi:hypothetical protein
LARDFLSKVQGFRVQRFKGSNIENNPEPGTLNL